MRGRQSNLCWPHPLQLLATPHVSLDILYDVMMTSPVSPALSPVGGDRGHEREQERRRSPFPQTTPPPPPAPSKRKRLLFLQITCSTLLYLPVSVLESLDEGMASSKRSRTQVYSGKKTSGPQGIAPSLSLSLSLNTSLNQSQ